MSDIQATDTHAIAEAAFYLWLEEGQPHGRDQEFWLRAEKTLTDAIAKPKARRATAKKAATPKKPAAKKAAKPAEKPALKAAAKAPAKKPAAKKTAAKTKTASKA